METQTLVSAIIGLVGGIVGLWRYAEKRGASQAEALAKVYEARAARQEALYDALSARLQAVEDQRRIDGETHSAALREVAERSASAIAELTVAQKGLDPTGAFNELRRTARGARRRVQEVAAELLADPAFAPPEPPPDEPGARGPS